MEQELGYYDTMSAQSGSQYCGYCWPNDFNPADDPSPDGQSCCWRETWRDYEHCIWHAKTYGKEQKPAQELRNCRETPENRKLNSKSNSPAELLDGAHLPGVDLTDVGSFKACSLRKSCLIDANLSGVDLRKSSLIAATLLGAHLSRARLRSAVLLRANMSESNLAGANLQRAILIDVLCGNINVKGAIMDGKTVIKLRNWTDSEDKGPDHDDVARGAHRFREAAVDNGLRSMARQLRYRERVERRREAYSNRSWLTWMRSWMSAAVTGYGVYISRIGGTMVGSVLLFAVVYGALGISEPLQLSIEIFVPRGMGDASSVAVGSITYVLTLIEAFIGMLFTVLMSYTLVTRDAP